MFIKLVISIATVLIAVISTSVFAEPAPAPAGAAPAGGGMVQVVLLGGMVAVFYFLLWRPQSKRAKAQKQLLADIKAGDEVSTASGIFGVVKAIDDNTVKLQVAKTTTIQIQKAAISTIYPKETIKLS